MASIPREQIPAFVDRFMKYVAPEPFSGCWLWTGAISTGGYGILAIDRLPRGAHRFFYEASRGDIPDGMQIDHLCRNRACVNPMHLEVVTNRENGRRGICSEVNRARRLARAHCKYGHPFEGSNLRHDKGKNGPIRACRTCTNARQIEYRVRRACQ